jgi:thiamine-phosphate pyrophosphorylase
MRKSRSINFRLYLITNRKLVTREASLVTAVQQALKGGVTAVQLREKDMDTRALLKLAYDMRKVTDTFKAKLFINDRFDVALAVGADGVHLTRNSIPVDAVRNAVKKKLLIGVSTHSLREAKEAEKGGADFITLGPVYKTLSKLKYGKPLGIDILKKVAGKVNIPVLAIGGIKSGRVAEVVNAGAAGAAMISEVFSSADIKNKAGELTSLLESKG